MSKNRSSALKRDREQRKAEKLVLKRKRREERKTAGPDTGIEFGPDGQPVANGLPELPDDRPDPNPNASLS